jgi:hypothetical protein
MLRTFGVTQRLTPAPVFFQAEQATLQARQPDVRFAFRRRRDGIHGIPVGQGGIIRRQLLNQLLVFGFDLISIHGLSAGRITSYLSRQVSRANRTRKISGQ